MTQLASPVVRGRWSAGGSFLARTGRRTLVESLYLFTAPLIAGTGLMLVLGGLCVAVADCVLPRRARVAVRALTPACWLADLERWRIAGVRPAAPGAVADSAVPAGRGRQRRPILSAADPRLWLDAAHALVIWPVTLITSAVTALWWFLGLAAATSALRWEYASPLGAGGAHAATVSDVKLGSGTMLGLAILAALPLVTRTCVVIQAGLGQALLSDNSPLRRRFSGLGPEPPAAEVLADAAALRRLERDLHDGPQQRLVRLAMDLGRAQHQFDSRPEVVREAIADAIASTQEALGELRVLSRGIAPPILADRGLRAALAALAARASVAVDLDADPLADRLDAAVETAAYFVVAEALTNVAKHSQAARCVIGLRHRAGVLRVWVTDDGAGGAAVASGHGLRGLEDRLQPLGGQLTVASPRGGPTTITAELPCC